MKKILVFSFLIMCISEVFANSSYTYSPAYISHLKNCSPYTDEFTVDIPTGDSTSPYLKVKSSEQIIGWLDGKCVTKNTIHSLDLNNTIMTIKCNLSKEQVSSIMEKMKSVNAEGSVEAKQILSDEMVRIIEDGLTCKVKKYLSE